MDNVVEFRREPVVDTLRLDATPIGNTLEALIEEANADPAAEARFTAFLARAAKGIERVGFLSVAPLAGGGFVVTAEPSAALLALLSSPGEAA